MNVRLALASAFIALALTGCGGSGSGGGSNIGNVSAPVAPPPERVSMQLVAGPRRKEFFAFGSTFGGASYDDVAETRAFTTLTFVPRWSGTNGAMVGQLQEAQMPAILAIGDCVFDANGYVGDDEARRRLSALFDTLQASDVLHWVCKLYIDEPPFGDDPLRQAIAIQREVAAGRGMSVRIMVCYGDYGRGVEDYPALDAVDDPVFDAYGERLLPLMRGGRIDRLCARLDPIRQRYYMTWGVGGGVSQLSASDLRIATPYMLADKMCGGVSLFTWFDRDEGAGARSNGLAPSIAESGALFLEYNQQEGNSI